LQTNEDLISSGVQMYFEQPALIQNLTSDLVEGFDEITLKKGYFKKG
jgi:hypothetical protein